VKDGGFDLSTMTTTFKSTMNYEILGVEKSFLEGLALDMPKQCQNSFFKKKVI
jgi:hypothetical protein